MSILGAEAGTFSTATAMYAAHDGEWVEVPLGGASEEWTRPADWLATNVVAGQQKAQMLLAIGGDPAVEGDRVFTLSCTAGYTVDWGDGSAPETVATGVVTTHLYAPTAGSAVSEPSGGYRQVLVTVTGTTNLTSINLVNAYYAGKTWRSPIIELVVGSSLMVQLQPLNSCCPMLRRVEFKQPYIPNSSGIASLFLSCTQLREVVGTLQLNVQNCSAVFSGCTLLTKPPTINWNGPSNGNLSTFFSTCYSLVTAPQINVQGGAIVSWLQFFNGCSALKSVPNLPLSAATGVSQLFQNCSALEEVTVDAPLTTTFASTFQGCVALRRVTLGSTASATTVASMFQTCSSLESVTGLDFSAVTAALTNVFATCNRLTKVGFLPGKGPKLSFTVVGQIDAAGLNDIYTQLPVVTGQTITVTGVAGTLGDDPTIATAKGWTVTGS